MYDFFEQVYRGNEALVWANGIAICILMLLIWTGYWSSQGRKEGEREGWDKGFKEGKEVANHQHFEKGRLAGLREGIKIGRVQGVTLGIETGIPEARKVDAERFKDFLIKNKFAWYELNKETGKVGLFYMNYNIKNSAEAYFTYLRSVSSNEREVAWKSVNKVIEEWEIEEKQNENRSTG